MLMSFVWVVTGYLPIGCLFLATFLPADISRIRPYLVGAVVVSLIIYYSMLLIILAD
jgi:hypothetical protein